MEKYCLSKRIGVTSRRTHGPRSTDVGEGPEKEDINGESDGVSLAHFFKGRNLCRDSVIEIVDSCRLFT